MDDKERELQALREKVFQEMDEGGRASDEDMERLEQLTYETGLAEEIDLDEKALPTPPVKPAIGKSPFRG